MDEVLPGLDEELLALEDFDREALGEAAALDAGFFAVEDFELPALDFDLEERRAAVR